MSTKAENRNISDEDLFKQPPQKGECPICFLRMPSLKTGSRYQACCGKIICCGCVYASAKMDGNVDQLCPFCRTLAPKTDEEAVKLSNKRAELDDAEAIYSLGFDYSRGDNGLPQDYEKALELWHQAAELDCTKAYYSIGNAYVFGRGVERNETKAMHYWELAAIGGNAEARYNIGSTEVQALAGNMDRALKHFMIAVGSGDHDSLKQIKQFYSKGYATKDDYANALRAYQAYLKEIKSDQRDKAAAFDDMYKYYE